MGNELSNGSPTDLEPMKRFQNMSPGQVKLIKEKFELMADEDLTIDRNGFAQLMKIKENEVDKVFQFFDLSNDGRIDSHEFVCALAILSQASLKEKASILFSLYDFDHNKTITKNELVILIKTTLTALGAMSQKGECSIQEAEKYAEELLRKYDTNKDSSISLTEFQSLISKDQDILKMLLSYGLCSLEDLRQDFGGADQGEAPEPDSDLERETQKIGLAYDQKKERRKIGIDHSKGDGAEDEDSANRITTYEAFAQTRKGNTEHWRNQVRNGAPSTWKPGKGDINPPGTWLELEYIYGFRSFDSRNNVKYLSNGEIVYFTAAVGVILDAQRNQQRFFCEHTDDITCIDAYDKMIATGQVGQYPTIYLWDGSDCSRASFKGVLRSGVNNLSFSNDGKKLAAVGMDADHTIVVYDVDKSLQSRGNSVRDQNLIASGKGPKSFVFDIKFDKVDKYLILACKNEVYFATYDQQQVRLTKGLWDPKTCPLASVLCIALADANVITGTFRGHLIIWKSNRATNSVEAHRGAVLAVHTRAAEGGIITGGRDGTVATWDPNLKFKERFVLQNLNLKLLNFKVQSVSETPTGSSMLIGTRGSDLIEMQNNKSRLIMRGHSQGNLRGLAMHPKQQQFYTIGEDNMLAFWQIKDKKMLSCVKLDYPSCAIHISRDCKYLAVGSTNGTVLIIDPKTLMPTFNFKDRDAEVSCLKFSHDTEMLAVGHDAPSCDILIYSIKNHFKKTNVLRGSPSRVISIDFSMNCRILQVNDWSSQVLYYELGGENNQKVQPDGAVRNRDEKWATYTAIYGWAVAGVWPALSGGTDINAVDRSQKGDIVVTADDYSSVKLFRFPAALPNQGYLRYVGHASHVTMVRFSADDEYVISLGGQDKSIFQWKVYQDKDAQIEQDQASEIIPDVIPQPEYLKLQLQEGDEQRQEGQMKQYQGPVKATQPTTFKYDSKFNQLPHGNLILDYVLGVKTNSFEHECFNAVKISQNGKVVYSNGCIGIVLDSKQDVQTYPQSYFRFHRDEINCIAIHPNGGIVASGSRVLGLAMQIAPICVWEIESKQLLSHLVDFHLRAVYAIEFSSNGVFLLSAGGDDEHSIAIHDWQISQLLCTIKTSNSPVYSISARSNSEFMAVGLKNARFGYINGRNVKVVPASLAGQQYEPMISSAVAFPTKEYLSGSINGNIFLWRDHSIHKQFKAHDGKVSSLVPVGKQLFSAGLDGKVVVWELNLNNLNQIQVILDVQHISKLPQRGIISLYVRNDSFVIATKGAEIYRGFTKDFGNVRCVMESHYDGEVWGVAVSPTQQVAVTCGGDLVLRMWDLNTYQQILTSPVVFDNDARAVDWSMDGNYIVVGDVRGFIYLVDPQTLNHHDKKNSKFASPKPRNVMTWIEDIKISPDSIKVAFGAHGLASHLEVWEIEQGKLAKQQLINLSLLGSLIHVDWAVDSTHLVINSSTYELKFVNVAKAKDVPGPTVKDLDWHTWTCNLGFPVQGIYKGDEYTVVSCCANQSKQILAVGDFNGVVNLYRYPAVSPPPQAHKEYFGHSSLVSRVRFSCDDSKLISTSAIDRGIFIWKTDFGRSELLAQEGQQPESSLAEVDEDLHLLGLIQEKTKRSGPEKYGKVKRKEQRDQNDEELFGVEQHDKGEEFTVIKPWMGAVKEPSNYYKDPLNQNKPPQVDIQIEYIHGLRTKDQRNNVRYLKNGSVVYQAASLGVILDPNNNTQKFFKHHTDDIVAIDVSSDGTKVATGQLGANPSIFVWDANTQNKICQFKGQIKRGVCALGFSQSGDKLAAVGMDDKHQLVIYDTVTRSTSGGALLYLDQAGVDIILDLKWRNENEFATAGINHLKFWKLDNKGLSVKRAPKAGGSQKYLCLAVSNEDFLLGATDGSLSIFREGKLVNQMQYMDAGRAMDAISVNKDYILLGGKDSKIVLIDSKNYKHILSFKLHEVIRFGLGLEVRSAVLASDQKTILVSTNAGDIYELTTKDAKINLNSKFQNVKVLLRSHYCPNKRSINETWGLAVNPQDQDQYYTCGDDGTLRAWSISQRKQLNMAKTNTDQNGNELKPDETGELPDSAKGRCITVSYDGIYVCVGFRDGTFRMYDKELKQKMVMRVAKEWISDMKFSSDSLWLAIGSHDNSIYIYSFPDMKLRHKPFKKHSSYITHLDFSVDGNYLHSNCGGYELIFWDVTQGKQLTNGANTLRDEKWLTWTATLGWPVQGIWPELSDGGDINAAVRTNHTYSGADKPPDNYHLVATGDDNSAIKIFRFPCVKKGSQAVVGRGHSSHITNLAWSVDDNFLFSAGGEDNCIIQWRVQKLK